MIASRQVEVPIFIANGKQRGMGLVVHAQVIRKTASLFCKKYVVPAGKHVGAGSLALVAPRFGEAVRG